MPTASPFSLAASGTWQLVQQRTRIPLRIFYLDGEQRCQDVTHHETVVDWDGRYTWTTPRVRCGRLAWEEKSPALWTRLSAFWPYRAFFFGSAFFCAELFFLVGLFFLGSAVFFDIQLNLRLVNYLLMAAAYFFPFFHVVLSDAATVQPQYKLTKICL